MLDAPTDVREDVVYHPPIPTRAIKAAIAAHGERQRQRVGLTTGFDLVDVIERNGGRITYFGPFDNNQTDAIIVDPDNTFEIKVSSHTSRRRDNFTMAHELGHYLLHWPKVRKKYSGHGMRATRAVDEDDHDLIRCEWEANWFAASFLMPEEEFRAAYRDDHNGAAEVFGVSPSAISIRARSLGLD